MNFHQHHYLPSMATSYCVSGSHRVTSAPVAISRPETAGPSCRDRSWYSPGSSSLSSSQLGDDDVPMMIAVQRQQQELIESCSGWPQFADLSSAAPAASQSTVDWWSSVWEDFKSNGRDVDLQADASCATASSHSSDQCSWTSSSIGDTSLDSIEPKSPRPITGRPYNPTGWRTSARNLFADVGSRLAPQSRGQCCALCRTNGESRDVYESHSLKDSSGLVTCPVLFGYHCPFCGATGPFAHTIRYCTVAPPGVSVIKSLKTTRDSAGHRRTR